MKLRSVIWAATGLAAMLGSIGVVAWLHQPATAEAPGVEAVAGRDVDMSKIIEHINALARPAARLTGSAGAETARAYIVKELAALGGVEITQQAFSVAVPVTRRGELVAGLAGGGEVRVRVYPLWPNMARTCQTPAGGLTGALVYARSGSEADLRGVSVRGALVVLDWDSDLAWLSVQEFGGRAVIFRGARPAPRALAQRKYLTVPADIPRYYVALEDVPLLDTLLASGVHARVECDVAWERVTGVNVLAKISAGNGARGLRAIDRTPVVFSAYYDSISVVPERAPGAEQACGAAVLLELARQLRAQPGARPVYALFTSGHGQALAGMTHYVEAVRAGACERPGLIVALDLSSQSSAMGVFAMGAFRPQIEMFVAPRYSTIGLKLSEIAARMAGGTNSAGGVAEDFVDGINNTSGRGWWTYFPYLAALESEVGTVAGIPSITLATVNDNRTLVDTPDDTRERQSEELLARQITTRGGAQAGLLTLASALTQWRGSFVNRALDDTWSVVAGRVTWLDQERDYTPNQPLADAMVFIKQRQGTKFFCGTRATPALMTDADGRYRFSGLRRLIPFEFPPPFALEAYATATREWLAAQTNAAARYAAMLSTHAVVEADGAVIFALDMARPEDYPWTFRPSSNERHVNLVVFPCKSVTLTGLTDPRSYVPLTDVSVLEAATKSPPFQFGTSMSDLAGADPSENIATIWTEPSLRVMLTGGIGFLGRRLILVNNTPDNPEGSGFVLAELTMLPSMVLQCARDMWNITAACLRKLARYGVTNPRVARHHEEAAHYVRQAEEALARNDYAAYRIAAERGWAAAGQAYAETLAMVNNMIHGVLLYLFLLLPLAYCVERLLVASQTIPRRIMWIGALFAGSFGVLALVHPAFRFTLTPFLVLLAFVIVALVTTVGALLLGRVDALLHARKQAVGGRHDEQYRRGGVAVRALDLGMSNIRRRPQRGFLTGLAVVIVTFILLSFTSLVPAVSISRLRHPRGVAAYTGLLSRDRAWNPLPEPLCDALCRTYAGVTNAVVAVRAWFYSDFAGQFSVIDMSAEKTGRRTTVSALLCVEPAEAHVTDVTNALLAGRWFHSREEHGIILSRHTAAQLHLTTNDLGTPVRLYSKNLPLIGIVDADAFDRVRDLDGEPLTPVNMVMQRAMRAQRVQAGQASDRPDTLEDYVHYSVDHVAIVPLWLSMELRGAARSIAVRLPPQINADD